MTSSRDPASRVVAAVVLLLAAAVVCERVVGVGDQLAVGEVLVPGKTVVSGGGAFALGFFDPSTNNSSIGPVGGGGSGRWYFGMWYNNISGEAGRTVVWMANRDTPANAGAPTLVLRNDSNLVLSDAGGRVLWTTGIAGGVGSSSSSPAPVVAVLLDSGNLVLRAANGGAALWDSFDHPTDTFLPGMKARLNRRTKVAGRIVSWKGPGDPSPGSFSYGMDPESFLQLLMWNGSRRYWRSPVWTGYTVTSNYVSNRTVIYTSVVDTDEEISTTFTVTDGGSPTRYVVTSSGKLQLLSWNIASSEWATLLSLPSHDCNVYGYCGPNGYCDITQAVSACRCLDGFEPASAGEWSDGRFSQGCRRKEPLLLPPCSGVGVGGEKDDFLAMPNMKLPDRFVLDAGNRTSEECAARCAMNCSCVAYAYANLKTSSAKAEVRRCLVWAGELVDTQMIGSQWGVAAETLYLRVPATATAASTGKSSGKNRVKIVLSVLAGALMLTCIFTVWFCRFRGRRRRNDIEKKVVPQSANPSETGEGNHTEDLEFPSIGFADIVNATDNFSVNLMIGRGGFGKVYKGTLEGGREVAVKRLSKDSDQGAEEFKNEGILIAKLQHRNLVRLLGCCTEGDEKLLVYEYLPNKGLDAILFDCERKSVLDWSTRLGIIKGVARGLLYLHQDSRLTVIHRDLKASNVLLDAEMRPKIADFGMAKIFPDNQMDANTKRVVGTYGYIAPEYTTEGVFSVKSDVYSFGVLLLEIVSGVRVSSPDGIMEFPSLIIYAWNLWMEGRASALADPSMAAERSSSSSPLPDEAEVSLFVHVGLLCVEDDPGRRPLMSSVVSILENGGASAMAASASLPAPNLPAYFARMTQEKSSGRGDLKNTRNSMTMTILQGR